MVFKNAFFIIKFCGMCMHTEATSGMHKHCEGEPEQADRVNIATYVTDL